MVSSERATYTILDIGDIIKDFLLFIKPISKN